MPYVCKEFYFPLEKVMNPVAPISVPTGVNKLTIKQIR